MLQRRDLPRGAMGALAGALALSLAACGGNGAGTDTAADDAEDKTAAPVATEEVAGGDITVTGTEYAFAGIPATIAAGETSFTLVNEGKEKHEMGMVKLTDDAPPVTDLIRMPQKKASKYFAQEVGGIRPIKPGDTSEPFTTKLSPGRYGVACFIQAPDKTPHAVKGMVAEFRVE